jgi:RNA polymerase primary sigma factor
LTRPVALSDRAVLGLARIKAVRKAHLQVHCCEPTNDDLSRASGFTPAQVESLLAVERTPRGMDEPLTAEKGAMATVGDTISDPAAELAFDRVLDEIEIREARDFADQLDERERAVIRGHYGLGQPAQTLSQIGDTLGLTAERARQIELAALNKLRDALARPAAAGGEPV